jgi:ligand-binding sensor domain-containing protein/serine phosphatase RsbU (regulator of sigma subunit)
MGGCSSPGPQQADDASVRRIDVRTEPYPTDSFVAPDTLALDWNSLVRGQVTEGEEVSLRYDEPIPVRTTVTRIDLMSLTERAPGTGTLPPAEVKVSRGTAVPTRAPMVTLAKDAQVKERNPLNFSSFGKLQGLNHGNVVQVMQDLSGQIWLASYGGGATRYDGHRFSHFTEETGLCGNTLNCLAADRDGNMWFGSNGRGLSRHDGFRFSTYTAADGLGNDKVLSLLCDTRGRIWAGTGDGVTCITGDSLVRYTSAQGLPGTAVLTLSEDRNGSIWMATDSAICRFDGRTFTTYLTTAQLGGNQMVAMLIDRRGDIWMGTKGNGLFRLSGETLTRFDSEGTVPFEWVSSAMEDRDGHLWFGLSAQGLVEYDRHSFRLRGEDEGMSINSVRCTYQDRSGTIWIGTWTGGLSKLDARCFTSIGRDEGLTDKIQLDLRAGADTVVTATTRHLTFTRIKGPRMRHYRLTGPEYDVILCQMPDSGGVTWYGTLNSGVYRSDGRTTLNIRARQGLSGDDVRCMVRGTDGSIWFGTSGGGVTRLKDGRLMRYGARQGLRGKDVRALLTDTAGNVWVGTLDGGLSRFDGRSFWHVSAHGDALNSVTSLLCDADGTVWVGTNGNGLARLGPGGAVMLDEAAGLSHNVVQSILQDLGGSIWAGTRFGLSRLLAQDVDRLQKGDVRPPTVRTYQYDDGFTGVGANGGRSMAQTPDGRIWVASNDRIMIYHPEKDVIDSTAPEVAITGLLLFNQEVDWEAHATVPDTTTRLRNGIEVGAVRMSGRTRWHGLPLGLSLSHANSNVTIAYMGLSTYRPKRLRYRYVLDGPGGGHPTLTDRTEAAYGNLAPGAYTFKVQAMNGVGVWGPEQQYSFIIRPPWWLTWWAYAVYALLAVTGLRGYIMWRERSYRTRQRELESTVATRTAELHEEKERVEVQMGLVEEKNREILDSIQYAQRIQSTILPSVKTVGALLGDAFTLYLPKDIVAGDFYWVEQAEGTGRVYFAVCDCTGHGVPGALVSLLCHNALGRALHLHGLREPSALLDMTSRLVTDDLNRNMEGADEVKDGMDASLCAYDRTTRTLAWAGANSSLYMVRKGVLTEVKGDKQPVGHHLKRALYTQHTFEMEAGDMVYLATDGFADQFGGPDGRKFQRARLRELLLTASSLPMDGQRALLLDTFTTWRGDNEQLDDVTLLGLRC